MRKIMNRSVIVVALTILTCFAQGVFGGILNFQAEVERASKALSCLRQSDPPSIAFSGSYSCVAGTAETLRFIIHGDENRGQVSKVMLRWDDRFINGGHGIHAEKKEAQAFVKALAKLYAPKMEKKLTSIFFSNANMIVEVGDYQLAYTYIREPEIDERKFVLIPKAVLAAEEQVRKSSAKDFNACKAIVAKAAGYPESLLSGDGLPFQDAGHRSFLFQRLGEGFFVCEIHPGGRYKIAALNGNLPVKYIAEGDLPPFLMPPVGSGSAVLVV
jgi:hypothetical protein